MKTFQKKVYRECILVAASSPRVNAWIAKIKIGFGITVEMMNNVQE